MMYLDFHLVLEALGVGRPNCFSLFRGIWVDYLFTFPEKQLEKCYSQCLVFAEEKNMVHVKEHKW